MAAPQEYRWIPVEAYRLYRKWSDELVFITGGQLDPACAERTR